MKNFIIKIIFMNENVEKNKNWKKKEDKIFKEVNDENGSN